MPTLSKSMCETEIQNASTVWPESVRPLWSTMVTDTMMGTRCPEASKYSSMAIAKRRFGVQRVEDRLDQQEIGAAFDEAARLLVVDLAQFVERDAARRGAIDVLRHRGGAVGRPHRSGDEAMRAGMRGFEFVGDLPRDFRARDVEFVDVIFEAVIQRGNRVRVERVGLDDVGAGFEILRVESPARSCGCVMFSTSKLPAQVVRVLRELRAAKRRFVQLLRLEHRAHGAVQNDDPLLQEILQRGDS